MSYDSKNLLQVLTIDSSSPHHSYLHCCEKVSKAIKRVSCHLVMRGLQTSKNVFHPFEKWISKFQSSDVQIRGNLPVLCPCHGSFQCSLYAMQHTCIQCYARKVALLEHWIIQATAPEDILVSLQW